MKLFIPFFHHHFSQWSQIESFKLGFLFFVLFHGWICNFKEENKTKTNPESERAREKHSIFPLLWSVGAATLACSRVSRRSPSLSVTEALVWFPLSLSGQSIYFSLFNLFKSTNIKWVDKSRCAGWHDMVSIPFFLFIFICKPLLEELIKTALRECNISTGSRFFLPHMERDIIYLPPH